MNRNGNPAARSGVYTGMCHALPALIGLAAGLLQAQPPAPAQIRLVPTAQNQPTDPISARREAFWNARREGRFADATTLRNEARAILRQLPVEPGRFFSQAQQVVEMYQSSGLTADARAVLDDR